MDNIFIIPVGKDLDLDNDDKINIVYSPLNDEIALCGKEDLDEVLATMDPIGNVDDFVQSNDVIKMTKMSLMPNLTCNFKCTYCYSAHGRSNGVSVDWIKVKVALDFFINQNRIKPQPLSIFISGGGEPLLSFDDILKPAIIYAGERARQQDFSLHISVVTNGSLLSENIARFFSENNVSVCVSFEVLADLQNAQRGHFDKVDSNILMLHRHGVRVMINSTVTPLSVNRMPEMANRVKERYPFVRQFTMEPVTSSELFASASEVRKFYADFFINYITAKSILPSLRFTFDDALRGLTIRHCPGKFCVTPTGHISGCHLCTSPKEGRWDRCVYGQITDKGVEIDREKFARLYSVNVLSYPECRDCFAKFSCGGECMARRDTYPPEYIAEICNFNRRFVKHLLIGRIGDEVYEQTGKPLKEYCHED